MLPRSWSWGPFEVYISPPTLVQTNHSLISNLEVKFSPWLRNPWKSTPDFKAGRLLNPCSWEHITQWAKQSPNSQERVGKKKQRSNSHVLFLELIRCSVGFIFPEPLGPFYIWPQFLFDSLFLAISLAVLMAFSLPIIMAGSRCWDYLIVWIWVSYFGWC